MKNKAVIFDLDGTLLDTLPDIAENINLMLKKFGYPELSLKEVRGHIGHGAKNLVKDCVGVPLKEDELSERLKYYNEIYTASSSPKTGLFPGISDMLKEVKKLGYKTAILTNKPQETTDRVVKEHLSEFEFDLVVGQSANVKCKPDKTAALSILEKLDADPEKSFMVGDGETDVLTAVNAGINGIAVLWGYRDKNVLAESGAKCFASTPEDILSVLR